MVFDSAPDSDDARQIEEMAKDEELAADVILKAKAVDIKDYELMKQAQMMTDGQNIEMIKKIYKEDENDKRYISDSETKEEAYDVQDTASD